MGAVKKVVLELVILGVIGVAIALTANAVRASKNSLQLTKNYFYKGQAPPIDSRAQPAQGEATARPEHTYQEVNFEQAVAIFEDPNFQAGAYIFVDARNDEAYEKGHIPGSVQADHYRLEDYIDILLDYAESAEKIIVYCNGGDCIDSILLCADLIEFEIPYENIYLFPGGLKEWSLNNMALEKGRGEEAAEE